MSGIDDMIVADLKIALDAANKARQKAEARLASAVAHLDLYAATDQLVMAVRPEVRAFALAMEAKLRENDHKGGWQKMGWLECYQAMREEAKELHGACSEWQEAANSIPFRKHIIREACDVANYAMFVCDVTGSLEAKP